MSDGTGSEVGFPIYLEDRTIIGRGKLSADGQHIEITFDGNYPADQLLSENLMGFSVVDMAPDRTEDILNNAKENNDGITQ